MLYIFFAVGNIQTRIYFKFPHWYILTSWLCGPLRALAALITEEHSSASTAVCRHLLNFITRRSFSISSLLVYIYVKVISTGFGSYTLREWPLLEFPDELKRFEITLIQILTKKTEWFGAKFPPIGLADGVGGDSVHLPRWKGYQGRKMKGKVDTLNEKLCAQHILKC